MSEYYDIYRKRLNRYGTDYQTRVQKQREREFEDYLYKTVYRVDFELNGGLEPASLELYKQDHTQTQSYLLTRRELELPSGAVLPIKTQDGEIARWMVWWAEDMAASGYNRYVVLKMTHDLEIGGEKYDGYFYGPGTSTISDTIKSATGTPVYSENNNFYMFITSSLNGAFTKGAYFEAIQSGARQGFVVSEMDIISTPGIAYISVDPVPLRDKAEKPEPTEQDKKEDFFWLNGGKLE